MELQPLADPLTLLPPGAVNALALTVAETVAKKYPDQTLLTPKQVADVLWNKTDRSTVNQIRDRLVAGTLVPGLPKRGGRWEVPVADLVRVYEELADQTRATRGRPVITPSVSTAGPGTGQKRRWRAAIGQRTGIYGFEAMAGFFQEVYGALDSYLAVEDEQWAAALNIMQMATSLNEGWDKGYQQAIQVVFDEAKASSRIEKRECKRQREELEHTGDYQGARKALDAAPDSLFMSRFTAQFYLGMSPGSFKKALERGAHPFAEPRGGATKGEVDRWFRDLVAAKHAQEMPEVRPVRVSRDLSTGRPYLVDISGAILADGVISNIDPQDVAYAASRGAGIRILSLSSALAMPWRDPLERQAWAGWRSYLLEQKVYQASVALAQAQAQDMSAGTRELPPGKPPIRP